MSGLFSSSTEYEPTPCEVDLKSGESISVDDWRIWSDILLEMDRSDGTTVWVPMENIEQIKEQ